VSGALLRRRLGTEEAPPPARLLRAGLLDAVLVEGGLRTIRYDGHEIIRAIAYVVRDKDWGTYNPVLRDLHVEEGDGRFSVRYRATCRDRESGQALQYEARIDAMAQNGLSFAVSAVPEGDFLTARCGFAVLHPLHGTVGRRARVEHGDGSVEDSIFPEPIEPWQPFKDIVAILHEPAPGLEIGCRFSGDVFEMEDQRAWSDASFKTYVRPLALPWPYTLPGGVANEQAVTLSVSDRRDERVPPPGGDSAVTVSLGGTQGTLPAIGLIVHPPEVEAVLDHPELLREIGPQRLLFHLDPTAGHGRAALGGFAAIAALLPGAEIGLEVAVACRGTLDAEMGALAADVAAAGLRLDTLMVSPSVDRQSTPPGSQWPDCPPLDAVYAAARAAFPAVRLGGGMLSYFTELNRKRPPMEQLAFVSHCTCPIVHASDDLSVMQSLEAIPHIVRSTRAIIGPDMPYRIGPSTIGMRQNPYGSRVIPNPDGVRMAMTDRDPRQRGLFAAAWTTGYVAATEEAALEGYVPGPLFGSLGLAEAGPDGVTRHPVFFLVQALARLGRRPRRACRSEAPGRIACFAADGRDGTELWIANLTDAPQTVRLTGAAMAGTILDIDESGEQSGGVPMDPLTLGPYAVSGLRLA